MKKILILFALVILCASFVKSSRILIVHPSPTQSHIIPLQIVAKILVERGHEVTFISSFPLSKKIRNYRDIAIAFDDHDKDFMKDYLKNPGSMNAMNSMMHMPKLIANSGNNTLQSKEVQKIMDEESFDVIIVGYFFSEFLLGLGDHFKCPTIVVSSFGLISSMAFMTGNPLGIPAAQHIAFIQKENGFFPRLATAMIYTLEMIISKFVFEPLSKEVYDYNFPSNRYRSYDESISNVSLLLLNTHFSSTNTRPYLPNVIEVGGLQIKPNPSPLPENIQTFLDGAENGAILFSLGTNLKSNYLAEETLKILLNVFRKIKQRVVMKWESEVLDGKPENVLISSWLPQDDILAHKNIKAFISHGGYGGVIEAKFHAVPIIGIPVFGDQPGNADKVVREGWGIKIGLLELTEEKLLNAIKEITTNASYSQVVKQLSNLSKDRPMNAQDTAIYWIEYVIRHHGAPHLHYPGADLSFIQNNCLDLIAFVLAVIYVIFKIFKFILKKLYQCCCRRGQKQKIN